MSVMRFCKRGVVLSLLVTLSLGVMVSSLAAQDEAEFALAENGPYGVGWTTLSFVDDARDGREVVVEVWYPAEIPDGEVFTPGGLEDAVPYAADGPFPLVLFSFGLQIDPLACRDPMWGDQCVQLASHGFVIAGPAHNDSEVLWTNLAHRPLDILFTLDQLAALPPGDLRDIIDTDTVGVTGPSAGGFTSMALTGAWIDVRPLREDVELVQHAGFGVEAAWPAFTDARIKAVMPVVPGGGAVFTVEALQAATVPTFILAAASDTWTDYGPNAAYMYTFLGSENCAMVSVIGADHIDMWLPEVNPVLPHLTVAYMGYHLQGKEEYAMYLTEEFIAPHDELAWGVYPAPK